MRVANAREEEVEVVAVIVDDGKVACDICGEIWSERFKYPQSCTQKKKINK